jgi:hypothetical protein
MDNSRDEIPLWTWYNGQFLFQFDKQLRNNPNITILEFFTNFLEDQNIQNYNFYHTKNQGTVLLLMYGLIVIPKEIWEKTSTNFMFATRNKFVFVPPTDNSIGTLNFLRLLRNSLSHANFSIDTENAKLRFWNNNNTVRNFEVEISFSNLGEFIEEIGKYYINEVKKEKSDLIKNS